MFPRAVPRTDQISSVDDAGADNSPRTQGVAQFSAVEKAGNVLLLTPWLAIPAR